MAVLKLFKINLKMLSNFVNKNYLGKLRRLIPEKISSQFWEYYLCIETEKRRLEEIQSWSFLWNKAY